MEGRKRASDELGLYGEAKTYVDQLEHQVVQSINVGAALLFGGQAQMGKLLDRSSIFAASDITTEDVDVQQWWGGTVRVRGLTGRERDEFESTLLDQRGKKTKLDMRNARARLVVMTVVDESGALVFTENDIPMLGGKSAAPLDRIYDVAARLSGISDNDMEELTGNSGATSSAGSPSG